MKDINKENRDCFIIIRVTEDEKKDCIEKAQDSKNLSTWARHKLELDNE